MIALVIVLTILTDIIVLLFFGRITVALREKKNTNKVGREFWNEEDFMSTLPGVHMASRELMMGLHIQIEVIDFLEQKYGPFDEEDE